MAPAPHVHRPRERRSRLATGLVMLLAVCPLAAQDDAHPSDAAARDDAAPDPTPHVETRLVLDRRAVRPGDTVSLGISFDVDPGWHLYWRGYSDSGLPIEVEFELPDGVTLSPLRWPAPEHLPGIAGMLDLVYEGQVTLVADLHVSPDVQPGTTLQLAAAHEWLVCQELCLAGAGRVTLEVPVVPTGREVEPDEDGRARLDRAARRLPRPPRAAADGTPAEVTVRWDGDTAQIDVPGAARLVFHPDEDCAYPLDLLGQGDVEGARQRLDLSPPADGPFRLSGILEVHRPDHPSADFLSLQEIRS